MKKIGLVGIGNMGYGMCLNLHKKGYNVCAYDINESNLKNITKNGVYSSKNLQDLANDKDIIITMLPSSSSVFQVWKDILGFCNNETIIVDCSTIDLETTLKIHSLANEKEIKSLDAPVSGGVVGADNGTLTFMVGGEEKTYYKVKHIFESMGKKSFLCGDFGSGQITKMCNNLLLAVTMIGTGEAFNLGINLGLNPKTMFDVFSTSTSSCWTVNQYCPFPEVGPLSPSDNGYKGGFSSSLMLKDLNIAVNAAINSDSKIPFGIEARNIYDKFINNNNGDLDFSAIVKTNAKSLQD